MILDPRVLASLCQEFHVTCERSSLSPCWRFFCGLFGPYLSQFPCRKPLFPLVLRVCLVRAGSRPDLTFANVGFCSRFLAFLSFSPRGFLRLDFLSVMAGWCFSFPVAFSRFRFSPSCLYFLPAVLLFSPVVVLLLMLGCFIFCSALSYVLFTGCEEACYLVAGGIFSCYLSSAAYIYYVSFCFDSSRFC